MIIQRIDVYNSETMKKDNSVEDYEKSEEDCDCEEKRGKREDGVDYIMKDMDNDWGYLL